MFRIIPNLTHQNRIGSGSATLHCRILRSVDGRIAVRFRAANVRILCQPRDVTSKGNRKKNIFLGENVTIRVRALVVGPLKNNFFSGFLRRIDLDTCDLEGSSFEKAWIRFFLGGQETNYCKDEDIHNCIFTFVYKPAPTQTECIE